MTGLWRIVINNNTVEGLCVSSAGKSGFMNFVRDTPFYNLISNVTV
jgi:hypothetical protein